MQEAGRSSGREEEQAVEKSAEKLECRRKCWLLVGCLGVLPALRCEIESDGLRFSSTLTVSASNSRNSKQGQKKKP